jgi:hypothetical protein
MVRIVQAVSLSVCLSVSLSLSRERERDREGERESLSTKDGLVRIMQGERHVGTIAPGRWSLLTVGYDPEGTCASPPGWRAQVDQEETARGVPPPSRELPPVLEGAQNCTRPRLHLRMRPAGCTVLLSTGRGKAGGSTSPPSPALHMTYCNRLPRNNGTCAQVRGRMGVGT